MVRHSGPPKIRSLKMFLVTFIDNGNFTKILFPGECIKRRNGDFVDIKKCFLLDINWKLISYLFQLHDGRLK